MDSKRNPKPSLLIADDERNTREVLERFLRAEYDVTLAEDGLRALNILKKNNFDIVLTDLRMPGADGLEVLETAKKKNPPPVCVLITAFGTVESAVDAMKNGASDFITKPFNFEHLELVLKKALESKRLRDENQELRRRLESKFGPGGVIAKSRKMIELMEMVRQVAPTRATVLITGESGSGKEVIAQTIHQLSGRPGKFLPVHCAALTSSLLESELFGHEKGSFTGAHEQKKGRFELADNGTLFLDEIGEIDQSIQVKLLRALETRSFERVGGVETVRTDTRVLAATNKDLRAMVDQGRFREDLYFRLDVLSLKIPPLRERAEDIPLLVKHYLDEFAKENSKNIVGISEEALAALLQHSWPGNVRELRNCVERMIVLSRNNVLQLEDVPLSIRNSAAAPPRPSESGFATPTLDLDKNEKFLMEKALRECGGNRTLAAKQLGISRRTLHRKINAYNLE
jgi:DNA-binding NtrC family response regulator